MALLFDIVKVLRPHRTIKSEEHNAVQQAVKAAFYKLGDAPETGRRGVSTPFAVGVGTEPYHAATKGQLEDTEDSASASALAAAEQVTLAAAQVTLAAEQVTLAADERAGAAEERAGAATERAGAAAERTGAAAEREGAETARLGAEAARDEVLAVTGDALYPTDIGDSVQAHSAILDATTASFTEELQGTLEELAAVPVVSQEDAEAGTATEPRWWTAERVAQAINVLGARLTPVAFDSRGALRSSVGTNTQFVLLESVGLFAWVSGSTQLDDDATCFVASGGAWELVSVSPEYMQQVLRNSLYDFEQEKVIRSSFEMTLSALSVNSETQFTVPAPGANPGAVVVVTPGDQTGNTTTERSRLVIVAHVSSLNEVTVSLRNPNTVGAASMTPCLWQILVINP